VQRRLIPLLGALAAIVVCIGLSPVSARPESGTGDSPGNIQDTCPDVPRTPRVTIAYGTVQLDGSGAPAGTVVTAESPRGDLVGCFRVVTSGHYGSMYVYGEDLSAVPPIPGMRDGE
jgi:hypothetical protein